MNVPETVLAAMRKTNALFNSQNHRRAGRRRAGPGLHERCTGAAARRSYAGGPRAGESARQRPDVLMRCFTQARGLYRCRVWKGEFFWSPR